jgi:hypothetical protein
MKGMPLTLGASLGELEESLAGASVDTQNRPLMDT